MTETLLLLNGQTVILTRDEANSLVQSSAAAINGVDGHGSTPIQESSKDIFVPITAAGCNVADHSDIQITDSVDRENLQQNFVQVKVNGKEIPGFVLDGSSNAATIQRSGDHQQNSFELLAPDKHSSTSIVAAEEGSTITPTEFLQFDNDASGKILAKSNTCTYDEEVSEERYGGEVYTISAGDGILQTQVEGSATVNELGSLHNIVKLPLVSSDVQNIQETEKSSSTEDEKPPEGSHTIVAIIHGEDGSSQSIEIPVEDEAYQLNLPHVVTQEISEAEPLTKSHEKVGDSCIPTQTLSDNSNVQVLKLNCNDEAVQGNLPNNASIFIGDSGEKVIINIGNSETASESNDVDLEPIFIIPEYGTDGNISTLQLRNSDSDASVSASGNKEMEMKESPVVSHLQNPHLVREMTEKPPQRTSTSLLFPNSGRSNERLNNIVRLQRQNRKCNINRINHIDWKNVTPKFRSIPKVPGSKYLRDIAKRTKFQNLSSLLDSKQNEPSFHFSREDGSIVTSQVTGGAFQVSIAGMEGGVRVNPPISNSFSSVQLPVSTEGRMFHESSFVIDSNQPVRQEKTSVDISQDRKVHSVETLTIKVNTGSIYESDMSSTTPGLSLSPIPSIKCEGNDGLAENSPPLTSIVYCSSEGDDPPQIVHLPSGDATKPLGSRENPIQLVQQGNTFQALQPVHKEQLEQITALLQQRRLSAPLTAHHDEIYDPKTNMKIVYKVVYPDNHVDESGCSDDSERAIESIIVPKKRRRGRPFKSKNAKNENKSELEEVKVEDIEPEEKKTKLPVSRTRSGRISRPPQHKLVDFRHLLPANFNNAKDTYLDYKPDDEEDLKDTGQVFYNLDAPKKRRGVSDALRLRYSCFTCKKLYMGRIENHYKKFPNHRRDAPLSESDSQSYSAIKARSDASKPDTQDEGEVGKPVLSPTPGTQASETNGEPSLPVETSAILLEGHENNLQLDGTSAEPMFDKKDMKSVESGLFPAGEMQSVPLKTSGTGDILTEFEPPVQQVTPNSRGRRGRGKGRRRGRGSWHKTTAPPPPPPPPPPVAEIPVVSPKIVAPHNTLDQAFCGYSTKEILNAVAKHLSGSLTPWQIFCALSDHQQSSDSPLHQWQERLDSLHSLLKQCKEDCKEMLAPIIVEKMGGGGGNHCLDCTRKKRKSDLQMKKMKDKPDCQDINILSFEDLLKDAVSPVKSEVVDHIQVYDDLSNAVGVPGGCYTLKQLPIRPSTSVLSVLDSSTRMPEANDALHESGSGSPVSSSCILEPNVNMSKETNRICMAAGSASKHILEDAHSENGDDKRIKVADKNGKSMIEKSTYEPLPKVGKCCEVSNFNVTTFSGKSHGSMEVSSVDMPSIQNAPQTMPLSAFVESSENNLRANQLQTPNLPSSSMLTTCDVSSLTTSLSSSSINLLLNSEAVVNGTTPTMTHSTPCVTPALAVSSSSSSLPMEVPNFSGGSSDSGNHLSSCLQMSNVDNSLMNLSTMPQVNTIGDLDITAEDLPRLLSEGMGIVVGSGSDGTGDGCDAPKLLDTSGDTTDLSEMLFKLQEATVGISQSQDPNLGPPVYAGQIMTSAQQQMNVHASQLMTSQSINTQPQPSLTSQGYNTVGQTIDPHSTSSMGGKSMLMQINNQPSAPLLTFAGALSTNSGYCNASPSISQQPINSIGETKTHHGIIGSTTSTQCEQLSKSGEGLEDRDPINLGFHVTGLSNSELEDILKR